MTSTFPPCGPDCLKEEKLKNLKTAMDSNPNNVQAKNDYYTALYGQDWLLSQKESVATKEVGPLMTKYRDQYDALTAQLQTQGQFSSLASALKSDGGAPFLVQDYSAEKSKADVMNRLWTLTGPAPVENSIEGIILYSLITLLLIVVGALAFVKYRKYTSPPPKILGGNRLHTK